MLTNYIRNKKLRFGGVKPEVYIASADDNYVITWSAENDEVTAISGTSKMTMLQGDKNSVGFNGSGEFNISGFETQNLVISFSHSSKALNASIKGLKENLVAGVWAVFINNNGKGFLVGQAPVAEEMYNAYFDRMNVVHDTGLSVEDVDAGNVTSITLTRLAATVAYPLDDALTASIINKTATFINFPV